MTKRLIAITALACLATTFGCTTVDSSSVRCSQIDQNFESGAFEQCIDTPTGVEITIVPENTPINPSPWYAFRVVTSGTQTLNARLVYEHASHRYHPKIQHNDQAWNLINDNQIELDEDRKSVSLNLTLHEGSTIVSGQPILNNTDYERWMSDLSEDYDLTREQIGSSTEGRPIVGLSSSSQNQRHAVIILGRQHPPELTGAFAFMPFVETLLSNTPLAIEFREHVQVHFIPNLNPDGVFHGYWRHNMNGVDLNRDWGPFTQPETQAALAFLEAQIENQELLAMLDFHSTHRNVFYTQNDGVGSFPQFTQDWLTAINTGGSPIIFERSSSHNPNLPTTKTYFFSRYGVPSITFELSDNAEVSNINQAARMAAETFMQEWLKRI